MVRIAALLDDRSPTAEALRFWCRRLDLNQRLRAFNRISLHAIKLYQLSYACICSASRLRLSRAPLCKRSFRFGSQGDVFSEHCHFHVSQAGRSHFVRALPGLWHGRLGIEPTTHGFGDRVAPLEHSPVYIDATLRCAFSSAMHCFCVLTVRRWGLSLCVLNFSRFLARLCGWCGIAALLCSP